MKYEVIIFDADETLFDFKSSEKDAFKNTMLEFAIEYDENHHFKIYQDINTAIWKEFEDGLITQQKLKVERFKRLLEKLETKLDEIELAKSYTKHLSQSSLLYDFSVDLLENLHKEHKLCLITNGLTDIQDNRIRKSPIAKYFEYIVISEEAMVAKPDPRIFEHTLNNLKYTDKSKILMIGDSLTCDIQGGINFGIDTCWYNPNKTPNNTGIKPTYEISNFTQLKDILRK